MTTLFTKVPRSQTLENSVHIPAMGLGTSRMDGKEEEAIISALEIGYRHIDTARLYGTEAGIGRALRRVSIPREEIFVTTKLWNDDQGYESALAAIDGSLSKLKLDHVDLYLIHWPDADKNIRQETWRAMEKIYESGKARAIGVSNYTVEQLREMESYAEVPPMLNQIQRHPFSQHRDIVEYCEENDILITNYSPLTRRKRMDEPAIEEIAEKHGVSDAQVLLAWGLQHGNIVIPKATGRAHLEDNFRAFDLILDQEDMQTLDDLEEGFSAI